MNMTPDEYLEWITGTAQEVCAEFNLPAACVIAQGALESQWGKYAIGEYNIFGRKAVGGDESITVQTEECYDGQWVTIDAAFKLYHSLGDAIRDWCELMLWGPYQEYALAYQQDGDLESFVRGIGGVYATDPEYADKVLQTIRACDLA